MKITSIPLPYEQEFALRDLLDAGLQNFCAEIEDVSACCDFGPGNRRVYHFILPNHTSKATMCKFIDDRGC